MKTMIVRILLLFMIAAGLLILLVVLGQRRLLYPVRHLNSKVLPDSPARTVLKRVVGDFGVEAWLLRPRNEAIGLIVHAHGNGEILDLIEESFLHWATHHGWAVLMPEYRGYSRSGGRPSKEAILDDFEFFMAETLKIYPELSQRVVFHGRSLGGGVVAELARRRPPQALILESTFTSVADIARERFLLPRALVWDNYDVHGLLRDFEGPVLLIHGHQDQVIPYEYAKRNFAIARRAELVSFDGNHSDTMSRNLEDYRSAISRFLGKLSGR